MQENLLKHKKNDMSCIV